MRVNDYILFEFCVIRIVFTLDKNIVRLFSPERFDGYNSILTFLLIWGIGSANNNTCTVWTRSYVKMKNDLLIFCNDNLRYPLTKNCVMEISDGKDRLTFGTFQIIFNFLPTWMRYKGVQERDTPSWKIIKCACIQFSRFLYKPLYCYKCFFLIVFLDFLGLSVLQKNKKNNCNNNNRIRCVFVVF